MAEKERVSVLRYLMARDGRSKVIAKIKEETDKKGMRADFFQFPVGQEKKVFRFLKSPEAVESDKFNKSKGLGIVGSVEVISGTYYEKEDIGRMHPLDDTGNKRPIGLSEPQLYDVVGEVNSYYKDALNGTELYDIDPDMKILEDLSFEVIASDWVDKSTNEKRKKYRFTLLIDDRSSKKIIWLQDTIKGFEKQAGITAEDMFGLGSPEITDTVGTGTDTGS